MTETATDSSFHGASAEKELHFTFVHGTFAPGAPWTQEGSLLRKKLFEEFGENLHFHDDFRWSGWPSHLARHWGGQKFRDFLLDVTARNPGRHYVVAHSHGGPVVLYALRDKLLAERIEGVVTLATPYLLGRRRDLSLLGYFAAFAGSYGLLIILFELMRIPLYTYYNEHRTWSVYVAISLFDTIAHLIFLVILALVGFGVAQLTDWFLKTLALPDVHPERLLIVRAPSDEATALIGLFHALELFLTFLWGRRGPLDGYLGPLFDRLFDRIVAFLLRPLVLVLVYWLLLGHLLLIAAAIFASYIDQSPLVRIDGWSPSLASIPTWSTVSVAYLYAADHLYAWALAIAVLIAFPALLVTGPVVWFFKVSIPVVALLGASFFILVLCTAILAMTSVPELGICAATVIVSCEPSPPGTYKIVQLQSGGENESFLLHSLPYTHPTALSEIAKWIKAPKSANGPHSGLLDLRAKGDLS
ncbi:esterase/lipase family protein [Bradyrhizobium sp. McL0615]|uniref:esterase/lipase family protein n=1 Tax=Bradyrhizobium sp. McL0615 TaxID=3415673 RepID=UPI003CEA708F